MSLSESHRIPGKEYNKNPLLEPPSDELVHTVLRVMLDKHERTMRSVCLAVEHSVGQVHGAIAVLIERGALRMDTSKGDTPRYKLTEAAEIYPQKYESGVVRNGIAA